MLNSDPFDSASPELNMDSFALSRYNIVFSEQDLYLLNKLNNKFHFYIEIAYLEQWSYI